MVNEFRAAAAARPEDALGNTDDLRIRTGPYRPMTGQAGDQRRQVRMRPAAS